MADDGLGILGIIGAAALGIAALAGVIFLVKITYDAIHKYLNKAKQIPDATTADLIKKRLASGDYTVVCNVLNRKGKMLTAQSWEGKELDSRLDAEFGGRKKITYDLTA